VPGFAHLNLGFDWHPLGEDGPLTVIGEVTNLLDAESRRAASVSRDYLPLPGRDARITVKLGF
jgi:iron complex outermembrane recepter protein